MADKVDGSVIEKSPVVPTGLPAGHGQPGAAGRRPIEPGYVDPADTTSILHGAQMLGKAAWAAGRAVSNELLFGTYAQAREVQDKKEAQERREREMLAVWNSQMTTINGVQMTNGEAQEARQHVIDNADAYADKAIAQGKMSESDREEFKRVIARKKELEDKRGRGTMTADEAEEARRMDASRIGKVADATTVDVHLQRKRGVVAEAQMSGSNADLRRDGANASVSEDVFQAYQSASTPKVIPEQPVSELAKRTGLNL